MSEEEDKMHLAELETDVLGEPKFDLTDEEELEHAQNLAVKLIEDNDKLEARIKELKEKLSLYENMRPEVLAFSEEMERILKANDHKGGWKRRDVTVTYLKRRLTQEISEFERALAAQIEIYPGNARSKAAVLSEACDVANFLMMICDVADALPTPPSTQEVNKEALKNLTQIGEEMGLYDLPESTQEGE